MTDSLSRFAAFLSLVACAGHRRIQSDLHDAGWACAVGAAQDAVWALADAHGLDAWATEQHYFAGLEECNQRVLDWSWKAPMHELYQLEAYWYYEVVNTMSCHGQKSQFYQSLKNVIFVRETTV